MLSASVSKEVTHGPLGKQLLIQASHLDIPVENPPFAGLPKFVVGCPAAGGSSWWLESLTDCFFHSEKYFSCW